MRSGECRDFTHYFKLIKPEKEKKFCELSAVKACIHFLGHSALVRKLLYKMLFPAAFGKIHLSLNLWFRVFVYVGESREREFMINGKEEKSSV